jgi:type II secretory pathway component PulC
MLLKKLVSAAVPAMIAVAAFFQAHAVGSLVDASMPVEAIAPFKAAHAATATPAPTNGAQIILDRNPFDSTAKPVAVQATDIVDGDPSHVPMCEGVRAVVAVRADQPESSFAALDVAGKRHLRKHGGEIDDLRLVHVGEDRVFLQRGGVVCQAQVFAPPPPSGAPKPLPPPTKPAVKIEKTGAHEYVIDRSEVNRLIEEQAELMRTPIGVEKEGYRLKNVKPDSAMAAFGLQTGDRVESIDGVAVTSPEGMMQIYVKLKAGALNHLAIHVSRAGKPVNLDYTIK